MGCNIAREPYTERGMLIVTLWDVLFDTRIIIPLHHKKKQKNNNYEKDFLRNGCNVGNINGFRSTVLQLWQQ